MIAHFYLKPIVNVEKSNKMTFSNIARLFTKGTKLEKRIRGKIWNEFEPKAPIRSHWQQHKWQHLQFNNANFRKQFCLSFFLFSLLTISKIMLLFYETLKWKEITVKRYLFSFIVCLFGKHVSLIFVYNNWFEFRYFCFYLNQHS